MIQKHIHRFLKQSFSRKPVVVETEPVDSMRFGHLRLMLQYPPIAQVVISDIIVRFARLVMPFDQRFGFAGVRPFRKPLAPPLVIFRYFMELGKVKRKRFDVGIDSPKPAVIFIVTIIQA